ncbi:MAG: nickel-dependent lactate racemase [Planctomycetaceae bacterium]|nr:nickel-dependent lactate racemase [Planctomycetaceae bacterium]
MQVELRYGRSTISTRLPDDAHVTIVRKPAMPVLPDPLRTVAQALAQPVGCAPLNEFARGAASACIAICDITRPVPNHLFLRPLIQSLMDAGIRSDAICVLVATGLHRPNEGPELAELVGDPWVLETVRVANHFARDDGQHVDIGRTRTRGTVVRLDRRFVEADVRIVTGLVEPHFMAGYSGGRKVVAPGLAHAETITTFHSARFMADPAASNCNFEKNPLHEEQLEIIRMLGQVLALNTVIDEERRLSFVNFGDVLASHAEAVDFTRPFSEVSLPQRFHTVVTSAAGYPLDKTYYQTIKGMVAAMDILAPGGDLIIASECSEGMGSPEFAASQQRLVQRGRAAFLDSILRKSHADIDEWQSQMLLKPQAIGNIRLFTRGLSDREKQWTGVEVITSLDEAVKTSLLRSPDRRIAVIPEGPYVVPFYRQDSSPEASARTR